MKFHLNVIFFFFYCKDGQTLGTSFPERLLSRVSGDTKNLTGHGPKKSAVVDPALSRGTGRNNLKSSFLTSIIL